jgi:hypothetical protein
VTAPCANFDGAIVHVRRSIQRDVENGFNEFFAVGLTDKLTDIVGRKMSWVIIFENILDRSEHGFFRVFDLSAKLRSQAEPIVRVVDRTAASCSRLPADRGASAVQCVPSFGLVCLIAASRVVHSGRIPSCTS